MNTARDPMVGMLAAQFGPGVSEALGRPWVDAVLSRCPDALPEISAAVCAGGLNLDGAAASTELWATLLARRADAVWNTCRGPVVYLLDGMTRTPGAWEGPVGSCAAEAMVNLLLVEHGRRPCGPESLPPKGGPYRLVEGLAEYLAVTLGRFSPDQRRETLKGIPKLCACLMAGECQLPRSAFVPATTPVEEDLDVPFASIAGSPTATKHLLASAFLQEAQVDLSVYDRAPLAVAFASVLLDLSSGAAGPCVRGPLASELIEASGKGAAALQDATGALWLRFHPTEHIRRTTSVQDPHP